MKRTTSPESAHCVAQVAYKFKNVLYVPHYRNSAIYVGPGYPRFNQTRYTAEELVLRGAVPTNELLWMRGNYGLVNEANP